MSDTDEFLVLMNNLGLKQGRQGSMLPMNANSDDETLFVIEDLAERLDEPAARKWRVLIVDDDTAVHQATEFALNGIKIMGRALEFLHAYSGEEGAQVLRREKDIAVILLDVVMERADAGLTLVHTIRNELANLEVRIILRTGQPGYAPEIEAIRDYDINDYKLKTELSGTALYTTLTTAIRSYEQIHAINASRRGLDMIIQASSALLAHHGVCEFAAGVITQIAGLLGLDPNGIVCALDQGQELPQARIIAAGGHYLDWIGQPLSAFADEPQVAEALATAFHERRNHFGSQATTLFFAGEAGHDMVAYVKTHWTVREIDQRLLEVFCTNIARSFDNVLLFAKVNDHAYFDQVLRIPNRLAFVQAVDALIEGGGEGHTLAMVDIDHFSQVNDALGLPYGDALLKTVTARMRDQLPQGVLLARVGGDAFGLLGADHQMAPDMIRSLFADPFLIDDNKQHVSATVGLVRLSDVNSNGADILKAANIALNRAKEGQRGEHCYFTQDMAFETRNRLRLLQDLRTAFDYDHLFVVYQPQLSLAARQLIGVEALLRWRLEDGTFVPPERFIPLAESSGLILPLGAWVMRTACHAQMRFMRDSGCKQLRMAVNVSVAQFRHPGFLTMVDSILTETRIDPELLELEITESVAMLDPNFMVGMVNSLKERRITVAVDDFGTGFSSLSYLEKLKVDRLKIDRSFVSQMAQGGSSVRIVETIISLGQALDLDVIAEGVETEAEALMLADMGCHEAQGYLFSRPLQDGQLLAYLSALS